MNRERLRDERHGVTTGTETAKMRCQAKMHRHWIAPHSDIFVKDYGYFPEESAKLAKNAAVVWKRIGLGDRRRIAALRRHIKVWEIEIPPGQLVGHFPDGYLRDGNWAPALANVRCNSFVMEMRFDAGEVKRMPDNVLRGLIAHEFAHLLHRAYGIPTPTDLDDYDSEELEADMMAMRWVPEDFTAFESWLSDMCLTIAEATNKEPSGYPAEAME